MGRKEVNDRMQLANPTGVADRSWLSHTDNEPRLLTEFGLYLYLTFEEGAGDEWWSLVDGPFPTNDDRFRPDASRRRSRRSGR